MSDLYFTNYWRTGYDHKKKMRNGVGDKRDGGKNCLHACMKRKKK